MTIELTTAALFLLSSLYGTATANTPSENAIKEINGAPIVSAARADRPLTLEEYVRVYFKDTPVLAEIARCESRFRHLGWNGKVLRGDVAEEDIGVMQINEFYHEERAEVLGFNLYTLDGNLAYARWLYKKEGVLPWFASSKCWQKSDTLARANSKSTAN